LAGIWRLEAHSMSGIGILILLYAVGVLLLVAEIFIPSHGILTVAALGFLIYAVVKTFDYGRGVGSFAVMACLIFIPAFAYFAVKVWHRTPLGKRISPPNPVHQIEETSVPLADLRALIGRTGKTISPLRPVGVCEFGGKRVSCVAEMGMIEAGVTVEGVGIKGASLTVVEKKA
jgi:membrane-bound ClpP family serine protease